MLAIADDGERDRRRRRAGTGLSIVRALVRDELRGTLDLQPTAALRAEVRVPAAMRILIAEDETIIRLDLRELLERAGFEVCAEARDGEEAVELARAASSRTWRSST